MGDDLTVLRRLTAIDETNGLPAWGIRVLSGRAGFRLWKVLSFGHVHSFAYLVE
jgi:hypothetical protein